MNLIPIDDRDDPRIAIYRDLPEARHRPRTELFVAEGITLVQRLLAQGWPVDSLLVNDRMLGRLDSHQVAGVPVYLACRELLEAIVGFNFHRGALACCRRPVARTWRDLPLPTTGSLTVVAGEEIRDPQNVGTLVRCAAAFGADAVLLSCSSADPFSRRALRVAMGGTFSVPLCVVADLRRELLDLAGDFQTELVATTLGPCAELLPQAGRRSRTALLFGCEDSGLPQQLREICDREVTLPMRLGTDSLNVGMAAAVFLYHFTWLATR